MFKSVLVSAAAVAALAGCVSGIQPDGQHPSIEFTVAATYHAVYRRAAEYVRVCHENSTRSVGVTYVGTRVLDAKDNRAEIRVHESGRPRDILEIITVSPHGLGDAIVNATALGQKQWDQAELQALQTSLESATSVCRTPPGG